MSSKHFDPRTKLFLLLICVLCSMAAPNLYFPFALILLIGMFAAISGKRRFALK